MSLIVPIGIDCGVATFLRDHQLRECALPFDWVVSYQGVSPSVRTNFVNYLETDVRFLHHELPRDAERLMRRVHRFQTLLNDSSRPLMFIRKGHMHYHHQEASRQRVDLCDDVQDATELSQLLGERYPTLEFTVEVLLLCSSCYDRPMEYAEQSRVHVSRVHVSRVHVSRVHVHHLVHASGCDQLVNDRLVQLVESVRSIKQREVE